MKTAAFFALCLDRFVTTLILPEISFYIQSRLIYQLGVIRYQNTFYLLQNKVRTSKVAKFVQVFIQSGNSLLERHFAIRVGIKPPQTELTVTPVAYDVVVFVEYIAIALLECFGVPAITIFFHDFISTGLRANQVRFLLTHAYYNHLTIFHPTTKFLSTKIPTKTPMTPWTFYRVGGVPMNKKWLVPAIAGIALMASACGNNAAPNYTTPNKTNTQSVRNFDGMHGLSIDGLRNRTSDGRGTQNNAGNYNSYSNAGAGSFAGMGTAANNNYNAFTNGSRPYNAFSDGHIGSNYSYNSGMRGHSIYQNTENRGMGTMSTSMPQLGYAQFVKNTTGNTAGVRGMNNANHVYVDREALAQVVGNVTSSCPGVQRSTVLVTDREVLVGLQTDGKNVREAKKQAKMNAMSVSPRYYKVHVTDNAAHIREITQLASRSSKFSVAGTNGNHPVRALVQRITGTDGKHAGVKAKNTSISPIGISSR
ncbi:hypothetical protein BRIN106911_08785 [Brevibacillus invocatus]